ncbi:choice-of-anchor P family protein [Aeromicrobium sp.]|uniref:choice-of-anchor P family protein n=1 Tax=Aeromicrobium sp. TaxID=1871063 RepID=UPI002FC7A2BE
MRLKLKMSAVASLVAVTALSIQGLSPATAAEGEAQATATPTPEAPATTDAAPAEAEDVPVPPAEDTEGLVDVTIGEKTAPIPLPLESFDVVQILRYDVSKETFSFNGDTYGGSAVGVYVDSNFLDLIKIVTRKLGLANVPKSAGGNANTAEVARFSLDGFFFAPGVEAFGIESDARSAPIDRFNDHLAARSTVRIARLKAAGLLIEGIDVTAFAGQTYFDGRTEDDTFSATTQMHVTRLKSGNSEYQNYDVPPNTTYNISGLGKVVLNEQKITELPGDRYAAKVNAIRITLSTASLGLPIGTNIYIGSAEAVVYQ